MINKHSFLYRSIAFAILFVTATLSIPLYASIKLRADKTGALYKPGEVVRFKAVNNTFPENYSAIEGKVFDSSGKLIYEQTIPSPDFMKDGWQWLPTRKGYFELEFTIKNKKEIITENYSANLKGKKAEYTRTRYSIAVTAPPLPMKSRVGLMGISDQFESRYVHTDLYYLADRLGFSFCRIHSIGWGAFFSNTSRAIEPEPGKYNWTELDNHVNSMKKYGFDIIGNILYTPRWASSHPAKTSKRICVLEYSAYAPAKMKYWTDFLTTVVKRYKDRIKIWEVWNEANFPGWSCFWMDTPENFIKLNASAYKTIKALQPESEIWLSAAYEGFYKATAKALYNYYDKFNLHGARPDPRWFRDIDKKAGLKSKPWVCSESHALLVRGDKTMSEQEVALNMLKNLLFKIKHKAERIALFGMVNLTEMEMLPFFHRNGRLTQASGLFRKSPRLEPRLCTAVIGTFNRSINSGRGYTYSKEYIFTNHINGVLLNSGQEGLLIVWNDGKKQSQLPAQLLNKIKAKAVVKDWEGNTVNAENYSLNPGQACFISGFDIKSLNSVIPSNKVLVSDYDSNRKIAADKPVAYSSSKPMEKDSPDWIENGWVENPLGNKSTIATKSAKFRIAATDKFLELEVEVVDPKPVYAVKDKKLWNYDSVQFGLDTKSRGNVRDTMEFILTQRNGQAVLMKTIVPDTGGDLPVGWTARMLPVKNAVYSIRPAGKGKMRYYAKISWSELYPLKPVDSNALNISVLVNNNDGHGRDGWLEWGSGIGGTKRPEEYGEVYFIDKETSTAELSMCGWKSWLNNKAIPAGTEAEWKNGTYHLKIVAQPRKAQSTWIQLYHNNVKLKKGQRYLLSFSVKAGSKGKLEIAVLKPEPPWTKYYTRNIVLSRGLQRYSFCISSDKLDNKKDYSLRFFGGLLSEGTYKISNITLVQLPQM